MLPHTLLPHLQLVLPAGLLARCLPRVVALSRAYHDEECEDLSEVTWSAVAARIGLNIEVRSCCTCRFNSSLTGWPVLVLVH
jgi:hypothetical protein